MKLTAPQIQLKEIFFKLHYNETVKKQRQRKKILKTARKKFVTYKRNLHKAVSRFLSGNLTGQEWDDVFKMLKEKNYQPRILYLEKLPKMRDRLFQKTKT